MSRWTLPGLILLYVAWPLVVEGLGSTHFKYMTSHCSRSLEVSTSLILALTNEDRLGSDRQVKDIMHCSVDLASPPGMKLFAHFLQLSIAPETEHVDHVALYDMNPKKTRITPVQGLYGKLDRSLFLFDDAGIHVKDYRTANRNLKVDYLGKPTIKNPGFRLLVTAFQETNNKGDCPAQWFHCPHAGLCVPSEVTCDGYQNCGKDDMADEAGCQMDTVTDLLENYSLARDILVVVMTPVLVFVFFVVLFIICAKRRMRKMYRRLEPSVQFSHVDGVQILDEQNPQESNSHDNAPPAYDTVLSEEQPPAYSSVLSRAKSANVVVESKNENRRNSRTPRHDNQHVTRPKGDDSDSVSSRETLNSKENDQMKQTQFEKYRSRRHKSYPSDSDNDDEEARNIRRKKGGRCKGKGKRQADDVSLDLQSCTDREMPSTSHRLSPLTSPSSASAKSVPYDDASSETGMSKTPSSASSPENSSGCAVLSVSDANERTPFSVPLASTYSKDTSENLTPIQKRSPSSERSLSQASKSDSHKCESSGTEADRKSVTESRSPRKTNSQTESITSSAENMKHTTVSVFPPGLGKVNNETTKEVDEYLWKATSKKYNGNADRVNGRTVSQ